MKKLIFSLSLSAGLFLAFPALAALSAPATGVTQTAPAPATAAPALPPVTTQGLLPGGGTNMMWPCPMPMVEQQVPMIPQQQPMMQQQGYNMMYRQYPCGPVTFQSRMMPFGLAQESIGWFGVMFVITVALVWVILLLVIALLWKIVNKHGR